MKEFKSNLRRIRRSKDLTQKELSKNSGLDPVTISRYERGITNPGMDNLVKLAKALNCQIDELVNE